VNDKTEDRPNEPYDKQETDERGLPKVPRIRLRAPSGVVIDYTLPLHEAIHHQWRNGEMQRVDDDEMPWEGDEYDLDSAYGRRPEGRVPGPDAEDSDGPEVTYPDGSETGNAGTSQPQRPADDAPKKAWQDFAVAVGAVDASEAPRLTRQQLIDRSTPPELQPGVQP
jgi:hypothetical protein